MDRSRRARTKKIFGLIQSDENTQKQSGINSPVPNNRRPSRPRPYEDDHQSCQGKKDLKRSGGSLNIQNPVLPKRQRRQTVKLVKKSPEKQILKPDFDDDDSVEDITYDPMIAGDFSSSDDSENELLSKVKKVKKQLFTPMKKESKKKKIQHDSVVLLKQAVIETDKTPKYRPISDNQIQTSYDKQTNIEELITPDDLGFVPHVYPKNHNIDDDFIFDEELNNPRNEVGISNLDQPMDSSLIRQPSSLACLALRSLEAAKKSTVDLSSIEPAPLDNLSGDCSDIDELNTEQNNDNNLNELQVQLNENDIISPQMNRTRPIEHSSTKKNPRKRTLNISKWKKTIAKTKRLRGLSYVSVTKKKPEIRARELKPPCQESCRKKCHEKLTEENRRTLFTQFWKNTDSWDQRRQYIANNIKVSLKKYMKTTSTIENDKRKFTHNYTIPMKTGNITVCKTMFLNTFDISEKFVRTCLAKTLDSGLITPDQRGHHIPANKTPEHVVESVVNHISSYPSYQSHYNRENTNRKFLGPELNICTMYKQYVELMKDHNKKEEDIAKSWLYREIFNTKFNLSFKLLEMDTCDDCDRFQRKILDTTSEEEKEIVVAQKNKHLEEAERRYNLKKADKEECYKNKNTRVLFLDLQKCLPTPYLTNTQSFYLRKLWTLNLTIYEASEKKSFNYVWPENTAGRGGNEIGSCLLKWAEKNLTNKMITETITWTDNCQGQNRNMMLVLTYLWIMAKYPHVKTMKHKFLLKGHTHMEVDHVHSIIERKKKTLNTMEIAVPRDWAQFLRSCSGKNVFQVTEMTKDDFKDVTALTKKTSGPFVLRKKNAKQDDFKISETVVWKFDRSKPGTLFYKTDFTQDSYNEVDLVRKVGKSFKCPIFFLLSLPNIRETEKPISTAKYNDLMTLLQWVPKDFHCYYQNLKHTGNASDLPEI